MARRKAAIRLQPGESILELTLAEQLRQAEIPFESQHRFSTTRRYKADFAFPEARLLVEIEGGTFRGDVGHNSIGGIKRDIEKQALAIREGWKVLRLHSDMVNDGTGLAIIREVIKKGPLHERTDPEHDPVE